MELVINTSTVTLSKNTDFEISEPQGLLNSNYQSLVKTAHKNASTSSVFSRRQRVKAQRFRLATYTEALLKFSICTAILLAVVS
ncbi:hypothetical protein M0G43_06435 [Subsaxibacter sp. CAU 1640]|uniref:hypothetical protein n=1 Tax=Subsaxibacter sp. CAU 1640 TaxID=2933271 RepID=UPI002004EBB0|nr:hypothetical protein [Subsaxibacter sp. CAU 1640]MCK7590202.1 hypothetical protein [Subsaxibacter sp. CAU 1640]